MRAPAGRLTGATGPEGTLPWTHGGLVALRGGLVALRGGHCRIQVTQEHDRLHL